LLTGPGRHNVTRVTKFLYPLCLVVVLAVGCGEEHVSATGGSPSAAAAAAFGTALRHRYGNITGYWTCPAAPSSIPQRQMSIWCLAEFRIGQTWQQAAAIVYLKRGSVTVTGPRAFTRWRRHWAPFSRYFMIRSEIEVPGTISVNSPSYDWGWLAGCARSAQDHSQSCDAYDGDGRGLMRFYGFRCAGTRTLVTCTNKLGDSLRWRPRSMMIPGSHPSGFITSRGPRAMNCELAADPQRHSHAYLSCGANRPRRPWRRYIEVTMNQSGTPLMTCPGVGCRNSGPVPTLPPGRSIELGPFRCTSLSGGAVRCVAVATGHGFRMSVRGFKPL
jgi:hypothetical protein